jgi:hypothetical protein
VEGGNLVGCHRNAGKERGGKAENPHQKKKEEQAFLLPEGETKNTGKKRKRRKSFTGCRKREGGRREGAASDGESEWEREKKKKKKKCRCLSLSFLC